MNSNQNLAINGSAITSVSPIRGEHMVQAQAGYLDSSVLLTTFLELDPMRNMMMLQNKWDEQVFKQKASMPSVYQKALASNSVLTVNGQDGGFKWKMAVETDNCFRTVEDTSDQSPDGYIGGSGTTFRIVLNRKVSPKQVITIDKTSEDGFLMVADTPEPAYIGHGYEHYVYLMGSAQDPDKVYMADLLEADVVYQVASGSFITELSEKLGVVHFGATTSYIEGDFKLGLGQGMESYVTGKADSYKMNPGYTTVDSQKYIQDLVAAGVDDTNMALVVATLPNGKTIQSAADVMEIMTIRGFNKNTSSSYMFMPGHSESTDKGTIEINEGLWQQMRRGKIFTYAKKGNYSLTDLVGVSNYVHQYNTSPIDERRMAIDAGSMLHDNLKVLIQKEGFKQLNNGAVLLGASPVIAGSFVSGTWDALVVGEIKIEEANLPGIGKFTVNLDTTLNYINDEKDRRKVGINPNGYDDTAYSGYIWNVEDQSFSNNGKLPDGTKSLRGDRTAKSNVYLIRPERNPVVFGTRNGRYSSKTASNIQASSNLMGEGFFIYGFGAMWMPDPSKFVLIEVAKRGSNR